MSEKACRKCGHITAYSGMEPESCKQCGAIYRKVEEALMQAAARRSSQPLPRSPVLARTSVSRLAGSHAYIDVLRSESLYPTWRQLVSVVTILWYLLAVGFLIGGVIALRGSFSAGWAGICAAVFIAVFAKVGKELSLMLADLSDATVRMAAKAEAERP